MRTLVALRPLMTHTASSTILTAAGGLFMPLTSVMSFFVSVSSARTAAFSAGIASARSPSHSSLMAVTAAASPAAAASSTLTTARTWAQAQLTRGQQVHLTGSCACMSAHARTLSASAVSRSTFTSSASVSALAATSCGCSTSSSPFIALTWPSVKRSFSRPFS